MMWCKRYDVVCFLKMHQIHKQNFFTLQIYKLVEETITLLLEFNQETQTPLEWTLDKCYTGSSDVVSICLSALAQVFISRSEGGQETLV